MRLLVVVDMQNDFIDGDLGTPEARAIVPNAAAKIINADSDTITVFTRDTHFANYSQTLEGEKLPVKHCINNTYGWRINEKIAEAWVKSGSKVIRSAEFRDNNTIIKNTFGSRLLYGFLTREGHNFDEIELIGLCTDICVISNALMARMALPDMRITVDASCCAGTTPEAHKAALTAMKSCQIDIINEE